MKRMMIKTSTGYLFYDSVLGSKPIVKTVTANMATLFSDSQLVDSLMNGDYLGSSKWTLIVVDINLVDFEEITTKQDMYQTFADFCKLNRT